jgi:phosphoserine phosphatase
VEVERLTRAAMEGAIALESVYGRRLELVRPDAARLERLGREYVAALVPDAAAVVAALRAAGIAVRVLSGGLRPAVEAVAGALGLRAADVAAVDIRFDAAGAYAGFDEASPLARSGGKPSVIDAWRRELDGPLMLVGDGVTDAEAAAGVDIFVAYAGVVERPAVVAAADAVIRSASLAPVLPLALAGERPADPAAASLFDHGLALLDPELRALLNHTHTAGH